MGEIPKDEESMLCFLGRLAGRTEVRNPNVPLKLMMGEALSPVVARPTMESDPVDTELLWHNVRNDNSGEERPSVEVGLSGPREAAMEEKGGECEEHAEFLTISQESSVEGEYMSENLD